MDRTVDPLGILTTTADVLAAADSVEINHDAVADVARRIATRELVTPEWDQHLHWSGEPDQTANYVLVLDALNFSFWGEPRWRVNYRGEWYDGYWALAAALKRALEAGTPLYDAEYLSRIDAAQLAQIMAGEHDIPLLAERVANLREVGQGLKQTGGTFSRLITNAGGSAIRLVELVVEHFPSFNDVARFQGREIRFYKRAQILAADLYGSFHGQGFGRFHDLDHLTAFADYKVPQVLYQLGILIYTPELQERLRRRLELEPGSQMELEIRAATIWGIEFLRRELQRLGQPLAAYQLDWALWRLGQDLPQETLPYHRTRTIFY